MSTRLASRARPVRRTLLAAFVLALLAGCNTGTGGTADGGSPVAASSDEGDGAAAPATAPPTTRAPRSFTLVAVGDILLHASLIAEGKAAAGGKGYDFNHMFDGTRDLISAADFAICHQETPISADNTELTVPRTLSFNAPRELATALKGAGFDACDTASNHTWDRNLKGVNDTLDMLDAAGIGHSGSGRNQAEMDSPPIYPVKDVPVGHLAYTYGAYNTGGPDTQVPAEAPWLRDMVWPIQGAAGILADARQLRERGAEFVVVSMHWGDQYVHQPNAQQRQLAQELLTSPDVDLILGDHVHVVQPCEKIGDKYVTYGMGNFLSNQSPTQDKTLRDDNQDGSLQQFTVTEVAPGQLKVTAFQYAPTWVVIPGHVVTQATPSTFKKSYDRTVANINLLGPGTCDATPLY